jgi:hypothetical protein
LWATVFFIGLFIHLGWAAAAPDSLTVLGWWPVLVLAALMAAAELFLIDLIPGFKYVWHYLNALIVILGGPFFVALAASRANLPEGVVVIALLLSGGLIAFSRITKIGTRHLAGAVPSANAVIGTIETVVTIPIVWLSLNHPYVAMVVLAVVLAVLLLVGPQLIRWGWFNLTCLFMRAVSLFKVRRASCPVEGSHLALLNHMQPDLAVRCRAHKLRWSGGRKGYLCLTKEHLAFVYCKWFVCQRCWQATLKNIRAVYFRRTFLSDSIEVHYIDASGEQRLVRFATTRYLSPLAEQLGRRLNARGLPGKATTASPVSQPSPA